MATSKWQNHDLLTSLSAAASIQRLQPAGAPPAGEGHAAAARGGKEQEALAMTRRLLDLERGTGKMLRERNVDLEVGHNVMHRACPVSLLTSSP